MNYSSNCIICDDFVYNGILTFVQEVFVEEIDIQQKCDDTNMITKTTAIKYSKYENHFRNQF